MKAAAAPSDPNAGAQRLREAIRAATTPSGWIRAARWVRSKASTARRGSSIPSDGQLPLSDQGRALVAKAETFARLADTPVGPEALEPWDRCLISSRGSGGPGMLNNIYNSNYQIVQTKDCGGDPGGDDPRRTRHPPLPQQARGRRGRMDPGTPWLGDSVGWWEGVDAGGGDGARQRRAGPRRPYLPDAAGEGHRAVPKRTAKDRDRLTPSRWRMRPTIPAPGARR